MTALRRFAEMRGDAQLAVHETESRDAIKYGKRTIAYLAIGADLWGHLLVERFNLHEELVKTLREIARWTTQGGNKPENSTTIIVNNLARAVLDKVTP